MNANIRIIKSLYLRNDIFEFDSLEFFVSYNRGSYIIYKSYYLTLSLPKKNKSKNHICLKRL